VQEGTGLVGNGFFGGSNLKQRENLQGKKLFGLYCFLGFATNYLVLGLMHVQ
jgi:hypothetical protein